MSIVKMKHLRLFGMASDREDLLRLLQHIGCVEISEPGAELSEPEWAGLTRVSDNRLSETRADAATLSSALATLTRYGSKGKGLFQPRPMVTESQLFDESARAAAMEVAEAICDQEKHIASIFSEKSKLEGQKLSLSPWLDLDIDLNTSSTDTTSVTFGSLSTRAPLTELPAELSAATDLAEIIYGGRDAEQQYVLVACHKSVEEQVFELLKKFGFTRSTLRDWQGTARENTDRIDQRFLELDRELETAKAAISAQVGDRRDLELVLDRVTQEIQREESKGRLLESQSVLFLQGWIPASDVSRLQSALSSFDCSWETADPNPEEYPQVPVKLKNNLLTRPLNMVTEMYSLPAYDGVDPNPLMTPFFILFYGIMMADMGYGLIMMLFSVITLKKARPRGGMWNFFALMGLCGISTFIMGAITGGFFGDFLPQIAKVINPNTSFTGLPALFTPLNDTLMILVGSMCLGVVQIVTGMAVSFVKKIKDGNVIDAVWDELTWWIAILGVVLAILGVTSFVLILGGIMIVVGSGWHAKGIGKVTAVIGSLYNHVTGYFGDILSYSRLMALMLAGSVIAQVFNTLGAIPGNIVIFLIISFAGNALNFALNLLGCFVHDLRLQCLEFFGKFYKDGGKPFRPLNVNTKYVDIAE